MKMLHLLFITFIFLIPQSIKSQNLSTLHQELDSIRQHHCNNASFSFWAESVEDGLIVNHNPDSLWPTASAIKLFILPAFYQAFKANWNNTPPQLDSILNFESNYQDPLSVFSSSQIADIKSTLSGFSYKEIAEGMLGKVSLGNKPYNACANIATFLMGGPSGTTARIHAIDTSFLDVRIGRYMLQARTDSNDNINTVRDFATLIRKIHYQTIPSFQSQDYQEILDCIYSNTYHGYTYYQKSGGLNSSPAVKSRAGFLTKGNNTLIYAFNLVAFTGTNANFSDARTAITYKMRDRLLEINTPINNQQVLYELKVYPNPCSELLKIESPTEIQKVEIANITGETVIRIEGDIKNDQVDVSDLPKGVYFIKVYKAQESLTRKFIVH